jgi:hypothetical protein
MTARPPRASTRGEGKRAKSRGMTQGERPGDRADRRRQASLPSTDPFERVDDAEVVEVTELPEVPRLRVLVLEAAPHMATAQSAIVAAGHAVVSASGRDAVAQLRRALDVGALDVGGLDAGGRDAIDAVLVGLPGGEPVIDAVLARGPARPLVIAAASSGAVDAARRAAAAGADLATVRPHHVERLAPILLAAARLVEQRRRLTAPPVRDVQGVLDELSDGDGDGDAAADDDAEPGALQTFAVFQHAVERELARAARYGYPLTVALFRLDLAPPPPPPGLRGILRARAGNALVNALRAVDLATELDRDRFLVLLPYTDRAAGAELARRILGAVAAGDPVIAGGRSFPPKVVGAVAGTRAGQPSSLAQLLHDATQLLEQAEVTGAALAVEP